MAVKSSSSIVDHFRLKNDCIESVESVDPSLLSHLDVPKKSRHQSANCATSNKREKLFFSILKKSVKSINIVTQFSVIVESSRVEAASTKTITRRFDLWIRRSINFRFVIRLIDLNSMNYLNERMNATQTKDA